jgi:hypothetical protein
MEDSDIAQIPKLTKFPSIYSDETIAILIDVEIREKLELDNQLRQQLGLMDKDDFYIINSALSMSVNYHKRRLRCKARNAEREKLKAEREKKKFEELKVRYG